MTFRQRLKEIAEQKEQLRRQEEKLDASRAAALAALPAQYGFPDLSDFIRALRQAGGKAGIKHRGPRHPVQASRAPVGLARAKAPQESASLVSTPAPAGSSLDDPVNFGQLPDFSPLANGQSISLEDRARLAEAQAFANRVLHTSRVPAAVWREWRRFEKEASELLRQ